jgi:hypothetical protein
LHGFALIKKLHSGGYALDAEAAPTEGTEVAYSQRFEVSLNHLISGRLWQAAEGLGVPNRLERGDALPTDKADFLTAVGSVFYGAF